MVLGFTTGVFDLFHIGHLNILKNCSSLCDCLIVGVTTDELSVSVKGKRPVIPYEERVAILEACIYTDCVVPQETYDKVQHHDRYKFDVMFVGDDWFGADSWKRHELSLKERGVKIIYFPYTQGTSSTLINETLEKLRQG